MLSVASAGTRTMSRALSGGTTIAPGWAQRAPAKTQARLPAKKTTVVRFMRCVLSSLPAGLEDSPRGVRDAGSRCSCLVDPLHRLGVYVVGGAIARVGASAAGQAADGTDGHVVIAEDLAAQANARQAAGSEDVTLGN